MSFHDCFAREAAPESTVSLEVNYIIDVETDQIVNSGEVEQIIAEALQDAAVDAIAKEHCSRRRLGAPVRKLELATVSGDADDVEVLGACEITDPSSSSCSTFTGMIEVTYTEDNALSAEDEVMYSSLEMIRSTFDGSDFASATNKAIGEEGSTLIWHQTRITETKYAGPGIFPPTSNTPVVIGGAQNMSFVADERGLTPLGKVMMFFIALLSIIVLALLWCCCRGRRDRNNDTKRSINTDHAYDSDADANTWAASPNNAYKLGLEKAAALGLSGMAAKAYASGYRDGYGFSLANDSSKKLSDEDIIAMAAEAGFSGESAKYYGLGASAGGLAAAGGLAGLSKSAQKRVAAIEKKALTKIEAIDKKAVEEVKGVYSQNYIKCKTPPHQKIELGQMSLMLMIPGAAKRAYKDKLPASETAQVSAIEKGALDAIAKVARQASNEAAAVFEADGKSFPNGGGNDDRSVGYSVGSVQDSASGASTGAAFGFAAMAAAAGLKSSNERKIKSIEKKALKQIAAIDKKAIADCSAVYLENGMYMENKGPKDVVYGKMPIQIHIPGQAETSSELGFGEEQVGRISDIETNAIEEIKRICEQATADAAGIMEKEGKSLDTDGSVQGIESGAGEGTALGLAAIAAAAGLKSSNVKKIKSIESKALKQIEAIDKKAIGDCSAVYTENGMAMEKTAAKDVVYGKMPIQIHIPGQSDASVEYGMGEDQGVRISDIETKAIEEIKRICEQATADAAAIMEKEGKSLNSVPGVGSGGDDESLSSAAQAASRGAAAGAAASGTGFSNIFLSGFRDGEIDGAAAREKIYEEGLQKASKLGYTGKAKHAFAAGFRDGYIDLSRGLRLPKDKTLKQKAEQQKFGGSNKDAYVVGYKEGARTYTIHETAGDKKLHGNYGDLGHMHTKVDVHKCTSASCAACHPLTAPTAQAAEGLEEAKQSTASKIVNALSPGRKTAAPAPGVHFVRLGHRSQSTEHRRLVNLGVMESSENNHNQAN